MLKEMNAYELTALRVVEKSLQLTFFSDHNFVLIFCNRLGSALEGDGPARHARVNFEAAYRKVGSGYLGKVGAEVELSPYFLPRKVRGEESGQFLIWVPERVELFLQDDSAPQANSFSSCWIEGDGDTFYTVIVRRQEEEEFLYSSFSGGCNMHI